MSNISVGMTLPDFELPDQDGTLRKLSDLQGDNAMVLSLGRGEHCPASASISARWCASTAGARSRSPHS